MILTTFAVPHPVGPFFVQPIPRPCPFPFPVYHEPIRFARGKTLKMISWCPPPEGWVKINTDGAYKKSINLASAGALIRDSQGAWIVGFATNLGDSVTALEAEFEGILGGLELAWSMGFRKVIVESDCKVAVDFILRGDDKIPQCIKQLLGLEWELKIQHQYREGNQAADCLANLGIGMRSGCYEIFEEPPVAVINHLMDGINFVHYPRFCPNLR